MRVELYNILFSFPREIIIRSCRKSSMFFLYKEKYRNQKCSRRIWRISGEEQLTWQEIWKSNGIGKIAKLQLRNKKKQKRKKILMLLMSWFGKDRNERMARKWKSGKNETVMCEKRNGENGENGENDGRWARMGDVRLLIQVVISKWIGSNGVWRRWRVVRLGLKKQTRCWMKWRGSGNFDRIIVDKW